MDMMTEYRAFVASLTYDTEMIPMSVEDAQYDLDQWAEEGSIEPPEGFTAEIYAEIWNSYCPEPETKPEQDNENKKFLFKVWTDGILEVRIDTGRQIADIYEMDDIAGGIYDRMEVWDIDGDPKRVNLLDLVSPILKRKRWIEQEYRDYCDAVNEYGYDFEGRDE